MKRVFKTAWKAYSIGSAVVVTAVLGLLAASAALGHMTADRVHALRSAAFETAAPAAEIAGTEGAASGKASVSGKAPTGPAVPMEGSGAPLSAASPVALPVPGTLVREIERASEDLRFWEDRIDILGADLKKSLNKLDKTDQTMMEQEKKSVRIQKAIVPLLNQLLEGSSGWESLTEESFLAAIEGTAGGSAQDAKAARKPSIVDILEGLRRRESAFGEGEKILQGLSPEVLSGIIVAGLKDRDLTKAGIGSPAAPVATPGGSGALGGNTAGGTAMAGDTGLSDEQVLRILSRLDAGKTAKVFKYIRDEDPAKAAQLAALVLRSSRSDDRPAAGASKARFSEPTARAGAGSAPPNSVGSIGGREKQG